MNEERRMILKMLEEGKITADEAVALFEAMSESDEKEQEVEQDDTWSKLEKHGEDFAHRIEVAAERFSRTLESKLEGGLAERLSRLPKVLSRIPFVAGGETHDFVREYTGTFAPDLESIPVELVTTNGKIDVSGWEENFYKLTVIQKVRAKDRETARTKVIEMPLSDDVDGAEKLVVNFHPGSDVILAYELKLPRRNPYVLRLETSNGRVSLKNLHAQSVIVDTINGSASIERVRAGTVEVTTGNGSCKMDYVEADIIRERTGNGSVRINSLARRVECSTTNGSVKVVPIAFSAPENEILLTTTNGSVRCYLPRLQDIGVSADVTTAVGKATVQLDNFEYALNEKETGSHKLKGSTANYAEQPRKVKISAQTSSGSVLIAQDKEGEDGSQ